MRADDHALGGFVIGPGGAQHGFVGQRFLGAPFEVMHQAAGDVAAGNDADQPVVAVEHGKTAELMPVEFRHGAHQRKMVAERDTTLRAMRCSAGSSI